MVINLVYSVIFPWRVLNIFRVKNLINPLPNSWLNFVFYFGDIKDIRKYMEHMIKQSIKKNLMKIEVSKKITLLSWDLYLNYY